MVRRRKRLQVLKIQNASEMPSSPVPVQLLAKRYHRRIRSLERYHVEVELEIMIAALKSPMPCRCEKIVMLVERQPPKERAA